MKYLLSLGAVAAAGMIATMSAPAQAHPHHGHHSHGHVQNVIVSCYRGPWDDVIWDRPNPEFLDSLVAVGYSHGDALGIAERVCRDPSTVGNSEQALRVMREILRVTPPRR